MKTPNRQVEKFSRLQILLNPLQEVLAVPAQLVVEVLLQTHRQTIDLLQSRTQRLMHQVAPVHHNPLVILSPDRLSPAVLMTAPAAPVQVRRAASPAVLRHVLPTVQTTTLVLVRVVM